MRYNFLRDAGTDQNGGGEEKIWTPTRTGEASPEQIAAWKQKYPDGIYAIYAGGHAAYFKNPSRADVNYVLSAIDANALLTTYEKLGEVTFIGGSEEVLSNDQLFIGAANQLKEKLNGQQAELVNL